MRKFDNIHLASIARPYQQAGVKQMDAEAPVNGSAEVPTEAKPINAWAFLRDNFTVLSGVAVVSGITLAIVFLFSYLSAFSWHLIELIQYADVITFGVISVGIASGSIISVT